MRAVIVGFMDGWTQGPELSTGMSYTSETHQRLYDAMTYIGCGVAVLAQKGWMLR